MTSAEMRAFTKDNTEPPPTAPFGTILGIAPPGVPAYSSDYDTAVDAEHGSYRASWNGYYTGYKYQCVEYARRWLTMAWGVTFLDVRMAYEIFDLPHFVSLRDNTPIPVIRTLNGVSGGERPRLGSVLIWREGGLFRRTGHVAIVVDANDDRVLVAEQNVMDAVWDEGHFARALPVSIAPDGAYTVNEMFRHSAVLGWLNIPVDVADRLSREAALALTDGAVHERRR